MSGGAFDYAQYRIADIYTEIEDEIYGHPLDDEFDVNRYIEDHWLEDSEKEYVRKHHHTIPNRSERTDNEVIERSDMVYGFPVRLLVVDEECSFRCEIICRHSYTSFSTANAQLIQNSIRSERKMCSTMKQMNL